MRLLESIRSAMNLAVEEEGLARDPGEARREVEGT
jgi:hypothetical protein